MNTISWQYIKESEYQTYLEGRLTMLRLMEQAAEKYRRDHDPQWLESIKRWGAISRQFKELAHEIKECSLEEYADRHRLLEANETLRYEAYAVA